MTAPIGHRKSHDQVEFVVKKPVLTLDGNSCEEIATGHSCRQRILWPFLQLHIYSPLLSFPPFPYNLLMPQATAKPQFPYLSLSGIYSKLPVTYFALKPRDPLYSTSHLESWPHLTCSSPLAWLSRSLFSSCCFLHSLIYMYRFLKSV